MCQSENSEFDAFEYTFRLECTYKLKPTSEMSVTYESLDDPMSSTAEVSAAGCESADENESTTGTVVTAVTSCPYKWSAERYYVPGRKCPNVIRPVGMGVGSLKIDNVYMESIRDSNTYNMSCKCGGPSCFGHPIMSVSDSECGSKIRYVAMPSRFAKYEDEFRSSELAAYNYAIATGSPPTCDIGDLAWDMIKATGGIMYGTAMSATPMNSARFVAGSKFDTSDPSAVWIPAKAYDEGKALFLDSYCTQAKTTSDPWVVADSGVPMLRKYSEFKFVLVGRHPMASHTNYMPARLYRGECEYVTAGKTTYNARASCVSVTMTIAKSLHLDLDGDSVTIKFPYTADEEARIEAMVSWAIVDRSLGLLWDTVSAEVLAMDTNMHVDKANYMIPGTITPKTVAKWVDDAKSPHKIHELCEAKPKNWPLIASKYKNLADRTSWLADSTKAMAAIGSGRRDTAKAHTLIKSALWIGSMHTADHEGKIALPISNVDNALDKIVVKAKIMDSGSYWLVSTYKVFGKFAQLAIDSAKRQVKDEAMNFYARMFSDQGKYMAVFKDGAEYKIVSWQKDKYTQRIMADSKGKLVATNALEYVDTTRAWPMCMDTCAIINKIEALGMSENEILHVAALMYSAVNVDKSVGKHVPMTSMAYNTAYESFADNLLVGSILGGKKGVRTYWMESRHSDDITNLAAAVMLGNTAFLPSIVSKSV